MNTKLAKKQRLLIFIVAYNAEKTIQWVLGRIPVSVADNFDTEILVIDDSSADDTYEKSIAFAKQSKNLLKMTILLNKENQGYGGNQKIGYHYAIKNKFDFVVLLHGDGQYAPEEIPRLVEPLAKGETDAVFGSRMLVSGSAIKGGMPLYKFLGNKILTFNQNVLLGTKLSEFHSGYRLYKVNVLEKIPFQLNSNDFHFDTEIIIQLTLAGKSIKELPIPTYYGDEICHVNGIKYAYQVIASTIKASMQKYNLLYDRKFDCLENGVNYLPKFDYQSPHSLAVKNVKKEAFVLDVGCADGYIAERLNNEKKCRIFGLDVESINLNYNYFEGFVKCDLDKGLPKKIPKDVDTILMLDVLEHLSNPEMFLENLRNHFKFNPNIIIFASTGNIAFFVTRFLHLIGMFNYGKKGILDITHKRLFTRKAFINLFEQNGFTVQKIEAVPAPWKLIFGENWIGKLLNLLNSLLCRVWSSLFAYQFFLTVKPSPHLDFLLKTAKQTSNSKKYNYKKRRFKF